MIAATVSWRAQSRCSSQASETCVFWREEMVGERVADRRTGHGSGTFWEQGLVRPKLAAITVTGCHPILVICVRA